MSPPAASRIVLVHTAPPAAWPDKALSTKLLTESLKLMQSRHFIKGQNDRGREVWGRY